MSENRHVNRVARLRDGLPAPERAGESSSHCLNCGSWMFGERLEMCPRCKAMIFEWVGDEDLRHHTRSVVCDGY